MYCNGGKRGYPGEYEKGYVIRGLDKVNSAESILFHAGTITKDGKPVTNGGVFYVSLLLVIQFWKQLKKSKEELRNITLPACLSEETLDTSLNEMNL
jgi:phosphoribosylamine--glycine ligase